MDRKSLLLLIAQLILLVFVLLTGPLYIHDIPFLLVQFFGILLIAWALLSKQVNTYKHKGQLPKGGFIVMKGPYEIIRHPIYAGMLLVMSGSVQGYPAFFRYIAFLLLIVTTLIKMNHEEKLLVKHSAEYLAHTAKTHKLIPYFY